MADTTQRVGGGKSGSPVLREPFEHLIQHVKQSDPMLYEALRKLTNDAASNATNIKKIIHNEGALPIIVQDKATFGLVKPLAVGEGLTLYYVCRKAGTFVDCVARIKDQAPTGSVAVLDILKSSTDGVRWSTIFDNDGLILPMGSFKTVTVKADKFIIPKIGEGDLLRIDCVQKGSTLPGKGIEVVLRWTA